MPASHPCNALSGGCRLPELQAVVAAMDEQSITIDANHPLAGKELTFAVSPSRPLAWQKTGRLPALPAAANVRNNVQS